MSAGKSHLTSGAQSALEKTAVAYDIGNPDVVAPNYDNIVVISAKTRHRETRYRSATTISGVPTIQMKSDVAPTWNCYLTVHLVR
jgi:hypothetical protein